MSLSVNSLFEAAQRELASMGKGSERFRSDFLVALNRTLAELNEECDIETEHSAVASTDASITTLDEAQEGILMAGVRFYMMRAGHRQEGDDLRDAKLDWLDAKGRLWLTNLRDDAAVAESSIYGLGYVD